MSLPAPRPDGIALVTGASAGIGAEIARVLARRGHGLVLVARRKPLLEQLAAELRDEHGVRVETLACDLSKAAARGTLPGKLEKLGLEVDVLVNNAGFATGGPFAQAEAEREVEQVRVLCEAVVALTAAFLPGMVERRGGAILTVASTAGMQPLPYSAGYAAAKAHALAFSEALHYEVRGQGVAVTALAPGPVATDFWDVASESPIKGSLPSPVWISAEHAARAGVRGLSAGRRVVVPGRPVWAGTKAGRYIPHAIKLPVIERVMRRR